MAVPDEIPRCHVCDEVLAGGGRPVARMSRAIHMVNHELDLAHTLVSSPEDFLESVEAILEDETLRRKRAVEPMLER